MDLFVEEDKISEYSIDEPYDNLDSEPCEKFNGQGSFNTIRMDGFRDLDFKTLVVSNLEKMMKNEVDQISCILNVSKSWASALLKQCKWKKEIIIEKYMEDPCKVLSDTGLSSVKKNEKDFISKSKRKLSVDNQLAILTENVHKCLICLEDIVLNDKINALKPMMIIQDCGHEFCRPCFKKYLSSKVEDGQIRKIMCPFYQCSMIAPLNTIQSILDEEEFQQYSRLSVHDFVNDHSEWTWCPSPNCGSVIELQLSTSIINKIVPIVKCSVCQTSFCFNCSESDHSPIPCSLLKLWYLKCADDSETANWITVNTKDCPKCNSTIEKNGGCNHMTCRYCQYNFCWMCMDDWALHTDNYNCNRYRGDNVIENEDDAEEEELKMGGLDNEKTTKNLSAKNVNGPVRLSVARKALERYIHYYTRFSVHNQSLKLESSLLAKTDWNMETLQAKTELTWIDLDFYRNAIKTLLICRSTLKYSYAFAYYLKASNSTEIFEDNQRDLELAVENLSTLVENPILKTSPALSQWKQSLLDKANYVSSRREILLADIQTGLLEDRWAFHISASSFKSFNS